MSALIRRALAARAQENRQIRTGVMGAGDFGTSLIAQLGSAPGFFPAAVADRVVQRGVDAYVAAGFAREDVRVAEGASGASEAIMVGKPVVVPDGAILAELPLEVMVDSTGDANTGAGVGARCLRAGQHVVMVNVEADIVVGAALRRIADASGVVYTLADGDQPSLICNLVDWAASLGLEPVSAGKGTSLYPADNPQRLRREADPDLGRPHIEYLDGTKSQIEMASAANVLSWEVDVRGLHHPSARLDQVATLFGPRNSGGLFGRTPVVDFVNCRTEDGMDEIEPHLGHGVFVVVTSQNREALRAMRSKGVPVSEDGSRALLWRPYHLVGVETPFSVAQAALFGIGTAEPARDPMVEVIAVAKRDLPAGTLLDGMGSRAMRGEAELARVAGAQRLLPYGLAEGVRLRRPVAAGTAISYDDLEAWGDSPCWKLRAEYGFMPAAKEAGTGA
jgi:predicted homoserine dehydrogenase-like protein